MLFCVTCNKSMLILNLFYNLFVFDKMCVFFFKHAPYMDRKW